MFLSCLSKSNHTKPSHHITSSSSFFSEKKNKHYNYFYSFTFTIFFLLIFTMQLWRKRRGRAKLLRRCSSHHTPARTPSTTSRQVYMAPMRVIGVFTRAVMAGDSTPKRLAWINWACAAWSSIRLWGRGSAGRRTLTGRLR